MRTYMTCTICLLLFLPLGLHADNNTSPYEVVWTTPSKDVNGTMPLGNGELGLNAWVDPVGDLKFYIGRIDTLDESLNLVKVGSLRIRVGDANEKRTRDYFHQKLDVKRGVMEVTFGQGKEKTDLRLWVEPDRPVIVVEVQTAEPTIATAFIELWREAASSGEPGDRLLETLENDIGWYHRNIHSDIYDRMSITQGTDAFARENPILHRTFGAMVRCLNSKRIDAKTLLSRGAKMHRFEIVATTKHPATVTEWSEEAESILNQAQAIDFSERLARRDDWWREFWNRSWIHITSHSTQEGLSDTEILTRAYALQRYVTACAGRGRYPIKFNGSIFTVPNKERPGDPDFRLWGAPYWHQNTRLPYHPMHAAGDFDLMQPLFRMYDDLLPLCKFRTKRYLGHDGAYFPETMFFWGDYREQDYGSIPWFERDDKLPENNYIKREWSGALEMAFMMLEYAEYTCDEIFLEEKALPLVQEVLTFYFSHYSLDANDKLLMTPSQSLETWWECTNPMPDIAGLHAVLDKLLSLADDQASVEQREFWSDLKSKLPDLPLRTSTDGKVLLAAAEKFADRRNGENPELYAVFPFRLVAYGKPFCNEAIEALKVRQDPGAIGWRQDDLFMAYLGLTEEASDFLIRRAKKKHDESRFPVFWGPNYDWIPDQDHGGVLCKGIQSLLMQCDGKQIDLFPAWPKDWNCHFRLHAPYQTLVEGRLEDGKLLNLKVMPESRRKDVRILLDQH